MEGFKPAVMKEFKFEKWNESKIFFWEISDVYDSDAEQNNRLILIETYSQSKNPTTETLMK